jgi:hypothetical protein
MAICNDARQDCRMPEGGEPHRSNLVARVTHRVCTMVCTIRPTLRRAFARLPVCVSLGEGLCSEAFKPLKIPWGKPRPDSRFPARALLTVLLQVAFRGGVSRRRVVWGILWGDPPAWGLLGRTQAERHCGRDQRSREADGLRRTLWESGGSPFKTAALNHSATTPEVEKLLFHSRLRKISELQELVGAGSVDRRPARRRGRGEVRRRILAGEGRERRGRVG